jgi:hypothetical protein
MERRAGEDGSYRLWNQAENFLQMDVTALGNYRLARSAIFVASLTI